MNGKMKAGQSGIDISSSLTKALGTRGQISLPQVERTIHDNQFSCLLNWEARRAS